MDIMYGKVYNVTLHWIEIFESKVLKIGKSLLNQVILYL